METNVFPFYKHCKTTTNTTNYHISRALYIFSKQRSFHSTDTTNVQRPRFASENTTIYKWTTRCEMENKFVLGSRTDTIVSKGGGGPVLAEFEQAIGGRKLFVVRDSREGTCCLGRARKHLFDRIGKECKFLLDPSPPCLVEKFAKCTISGKNIGCKAFVFPSSSKQPTIYKQSIYRQSTNNLQEGRKQRWMTIFFGLFSNSSSIQQWRCI